MTIELTLGIEQISFFPTILSYSDVRCHCVRKCQCGPTSSNGSSLYRRASSLLTSPPPQLQLTSNIPLRTPSMLPLTKVCGQFLLVSSSPIILSPPPVDPLPTIGFHAPPTSCRMRGMVFGLFHTGWDFLMLPRLALDCQSSLFFQ